MCSYLFILYYVSAFITVDHVVKTQSTLCAHQHQVHTTVYYYTTTKQHTLSHTPFTPPPPHSKTTPLIHDHLPTWGQNGHLPRLLPAHFHTNISPSTPPLPPAPKRSGRAQVCMHNPALNSPPVHRPVRPPGHNQVCCGVYKLWGAGAAAAHAAAPVLACECVAVVGGGRVWYGHVAG